MKAQLKNLKTFLFLFSLLLATYMVMRIVFYIFNHNFFDKLSLSEIFIIFICGLRVDISTLAYINLIFIILFHIPLPFRYQTWYKIFLLLVFLIPNAAAIFLNIGDIFFFAFNAKRFTAEALEFFSDFINSFSQYAHDYWYGLVLVIIFMLILGYVFYKINKKNAIPEKFNYWHQSIIYIFVLVLTFVAGRGSVGKKPLQPITVVKYINVKKASIATNSVFTLIHSLQTSAIKELNYFPEEDLEKHFTLEKQYDSKKRNLNVVVIILESFSKEFIGSQNNYEGYTPFLDSLSKYSLVCTNAFADAERSIKGVSAIIAGIPNLMEEEIQGSTYQTNCIPGLGFYLKNMGYHTSFFHGGTNGTMSFDVFTKAVGFDEYYGRYEFNNDQFYDGIWGIRDEEFFQYFGNQLSEFKEPFCSVLFSLSSHHPYSVPDEYKNKFPKGNSEIVETVGYTDMSLRKFFEKNSHKKWFKNTLFVITSDHSFPTKHPTDSFYNSPLGHYAIPVMFYFNGYLRGKHDSIMQQHDLMPSILDFVGYSGKFKSFGNSIFSSSSAPCSYFRIDDINYIFDSKFLLLFHNRDGALGLYSYKKDFHLKNNLINEHPAKRSEMEKQLKAILQTHNSVVIKNKLCP